MNDHENNRIIAEFMGFYGNPKTKEPITSIEKDSKYHLSWDWLMMAVGKIRTIPSYDGDKFGTDVTITGDKTTIKSGCYGKRKHGDYYFNKNFTGEFNTIEATYNAVVEFIKSYNKGE